MEKKSMLSQLNPIDPIPPSPTDILGLTREQQKSIARWLVGVLGSALATWVATKGFMTKEQAYVILANPDVINYSTTLILTIIASIPAIASLLWGLIRHKKTNMVAAVDAMPEVAKIEIVPTPSGKALAYAAAPLTPGTVITLK